MLELVQVINSDALSALRAMPDASVQMCVTSPPYWGLRDYGLPPIVWESEPPAVAGGPSCEHDWNVTTQPALSGGSGECSPLQSGKGNDNFQARPSNTCGTCGTCGAWRGCLGLEPTPELYIAHLVQIFREVQRVLKDDGTLWVNIGDSYANDGKWGLKPKDLVGIPWMLAFALRADGWYLRSDIIWAKPNPMPESVTDRPTRSHEYIFLLPKSRKYYYDADAIAEAQTESTLQRAAYGWSGRTDDGSNGARSGSTFKRMAESGEPIGTIPANGFRNKRDVWNVATAPFADAHFAVFPPALIKPCILAGSAPGDVVLDPFGGSGTTGKVSLELGRRAILIEPKAEYCEMIEKRTKTQIGLAL